jgi:hypothetical protein
MTSRDTCHGRCSGANVHARLARERVSGSIPRASRGFAMRRSFALIQGAGTPVRVMPRFAERFEEGLNNTISAPDISTAMPMYHA